MASPERVVRVVIALQTAGIRQRTFSDLLLLGQHSGTARVSVITGADQLLQAPFSLAATDPLYKAALAGFSQIPGPARLFVGKRGAGEAVNVALAACAAENGEWYGCVDAAHAAADAVAAAAWAEANNRMFFTVLSDAATITTATTDVATALKDGNFFRTMWWYHPQADAFPDVATAVKAFAAPPGGGGAATDTRQRFLSDLFSERQLAGVPVVPLTETAYLNVKNKRGNTFEPFANLALTQNGVTAGGEWGDIIRNRDWLCEEVRSRAFNVFVEKRVPYTDVGIAMLREAVVGALDLGVRRGVIAPETVDADDNVVPSYTVSVPREVEVSTSDKAARILRDVRFVARNAGAITSTVIEGVVTNERIAA